MVTEAADVSEATLTREDLLRYFSVLSHDLKSPIFSIDGFSDLLLSDYRDRLDEEGVDFLERIRSSVQQLKTVLEEMGHVIKLLRRPDRAERVQLEELVEELRLRHNYLIEEGGVEFVTPPDLPSVVADREKLREVIDALLSNALTFTEQQKGARRVELQCAAIDGGFEFCVTDNGIGIDPTYLDQIFELGMKLDKAKGPGPGYGLYLARKIVEDGGGRLTVDSRPGDGSRFCFTLPKAAQSPKTQPLG